MERKETFARGQCFCLVKGRTRHSWREHTPGSLRISDNDISVTQSLKSPKLKLPTAFTGRLSKLMSCHELFFSARMSSTARRCGLLLVWLLFRSTAQAVGTSRADEDDSQGVQR
eukprot:1190860-Prorocentrum_minimum.AAC.2